MSNYFKKWSSQESEHKSEKNQLLRLERIVRDWAQSNKIRVHMMSNFDVNREEIDVALVLPFRILVIELKSGGGVISGSENGEWTCIQNHTNNNPYTLNSGRKNPYQQCSKKRYAMINYLEERKELILSGTKINDSTFYLTSSILVFPDEIRNKKKITESGFEDIDLPKNVWGWFDILCIDDITTKLDSLTMQKTINLRGKDKTLSFDIGEAEMIPNVLHLYEDTESKISTKEYIPTNLPKNDHIDIKHELKQENDKNLLMGNFIGFNENDQIIICKDNINYTINLNNEFKDVYNDLKLLSNTNYKVIQKSDIQVNLVNIIYDNENINFKDDSYFIIEPNWLINVTTLSDFDFCGRTFFNNRFILSKNNEFMLRGSIVHEMFETLLKESDRSKQVKSFANIFKDKTFDFSLIDSNAKEIKKFSLDHINALNNDFDTNPLYKDIDVDTEKFIINPTFGIKGKIDAVITKKDKDGDLLNKALELKTGKSWGGKVKDGHKFQVLAYSLLMKMKNNQRQLNPAVIYSGDHEKYGTAKTRDVITNYKEYAKIVNLRNRLVLADYTFILNYDTNIRKCEKCQQKETCKSLFHLEKNHLDDNLPVYELDENTYSKEEISFFNNTNSLLVQEYRTIKEQQGKNLQKSENDRIESGKCVIIDEFDKFDYDKNIYVLRCKNKSEFREMDYCLISDNMGPVKGECLEVNILLVQENFIKIQSRSNIEFIPKYLDSFNSERAFERNFPMIYEIVTNKKFDLIKKILLFNEKPNPNTLLDIYKDKQTDLNKSQQKAVNLSLGINDYLLIQGPPGTGKTQTIAHIINENNKVNKKILLSCYTHKAIDEIIKKTEQINPNITFYRIGKKNTVKDFNNCKDLETTIVNHNGGIIDKIDNAKAIINNQPIYIGTTHALISGKYDNLFKDVYDLAIIDEASQALITNILGVIRLTKSFILVGDHKQLAPVIQSKKANELSETLFEKLINIKDAPDTTNVLLNTQYRMPKIISNFISKEFYDNQLKTALSDENLLTNVYSDNLTYNEILNNNYPLVLVNVNTKKVEKGFQKVSMEESDYIINLLDILNANNVNMNDIGIIAPFRAQVARIRRDIEVKLNKVNYLEAKNMVDTVDRYQGDEKDIIILSLSLTTENIPEIFDDTRRINVALSRAKQKLIVIGNWDYASKSKVLNNLLQYAKDKCIFVDKD